MTATVMAERKATETAAAAQPARTGPTGRKERSIKQRTVDAAKRYLVARGYNVRSTWESESQFGFVAQDDGAVAFIRLLSNGIGKDKLPDEPTMTREQFEQVAIKWLKTADKELVDVPVRFDELALTVLCADRALIRHHINVLGMGENRHMQVTYQIHPCDMPPAHIPPMSPNCGEVLASLPA